MLKKALNNYSLKKSMEQYDYMCRHFPLGQFQYP